VAQINELPADPVKFKSGSTGRYGCSRRSQETWGWSRDWDSA